jgi:hypothetical protein
LTQTVCEFDILTMILIKAQSPEPRFWLTHFLNNIYNIFNYSYLIYLTDSVADENAGFEVLNTEQSGLLTSNHLATHLIHLKQAVTISSYLGS